MQIWMEGYAATGQSDTAQCIKDYPLIKTFEEAIEKYDEENPESIEKDNYGKGRHAIWGCELFDNEGDARKAFG